MGADRWSICPKCHIEHDMQAERLAVKSREAYGKVPVDEWMEIDAKAKSAALEFNEKTLREDWELGDPEYGAINFSYSGHCRVCGLEISFSHDHKFNFPSPTKGGE